MFQMRNSFINCKFDKFSFYLINENDPYFVFIGRGPCVWRCLGCPCFCLLVCRYESLERLCVVYLSATLGFNLMLFGCNFTF